MQAARAGDDDLTAVHLQLGQHIQTGQFFFPLEGEHVNGKKIQRRVMQHGFFAQKKNQIAGERGGFPGCGTNDRDRRVQAIKQKRGQKRTRGACQPVNINGGGFFFNQFQKLPHGRGIPEDFFIDDFSQ